MASDNLNIASMQPAGTEDTQHTEVTTQFNPEHIKESTHFESSTSGAAASPTMKASSQAFADSESHADALRPSPDDAWIAIMGMTGAGKSTFISTLIDDQVAIGHGLHSTTRSIDFYRCNGVFAKTVWLIDTPGFDDTEVSDVAILQDIATYLAKLYERHIKLSGIIYLHRITDPKMSGSAMKNLEMFKLLCGQKAFPIVRLVTTRWNEVRQENDAFAAAVNREDQLRTNPKFWQPILENGGVLLRHEKLDSTASKSVVESILQDERKIGLDIQYEMVTQGSDLNRTAAGSFLDRELSKAKERYERELEEIQESTDAALQERDKDAAAHLDVEKQEYLFRREQILRDQEALRANTKKLEEFASTQEDIRAATHQEISHDKADRDAERFEPSLTVRENVPKERKPSRSWSTSVPHRPIHGAYEKRARPRDRYTPSEPLQRGTLRGEGTHKQQQATAGRFAPMISFKGIRKFIDWLESGA